MKTVGMLTIGEKKRWLDDFAAHHGLTRKQAWSCANDMAAAGLRCTCDELAASFVREWKRWAFFKDYLSGFDSREASMVWAQMRTEPSYRARLEEINLQIIQF